MHHLETRVRHLVPLAAILTAATAFALPGCRSGSKAPPPDAQRPVLKTESELEAERADRIRAGQIVENTSPVLRPPGSEDESSTDGKPAPPPPLVALPGDIQPDILLVNDTVLSVAEVLYPLRDQIRELRAGQTTVGFEELVRRLVRDQIRQDVGTALIYREATAALAEQQKRYVQDLVSEQFDTIVARDFGGSVASFGAHLSDFGLTIESVKQMLERELVARQYLMEKLRPAIQIRRSELLAFYQENEERYSSPSTRELLMIEAPFHAFLPPGVSWEAAADALKAQARLKAVRQIRAAKAALQQQSFEDVARDFSRGLHAENGGSWGQLGKPLQPPYDTASRMVFEHGAGWVSDPIETETGWYLVKCGEVRPGVHQTFAEVQDEIRKELENRRFSEEAGRYVVQLASKATISSLESFVDVAVRRAQRLGTSPPTSLTAR